jgi:hypothetical protein
MADLQKDAWGLLWFHLDGLLSSLRGVKQICTTGQNEALMFRAKQGMD